MSSARIIFLFVICTFIFSCKSQSVIVNRKISGIVPYCGGARPTKEMQEQAQRPHPLRNYLLVLVDAKGRTDTVRTNADGQLVKKLRQGQYTLFEPWRYYRRTPGGEPLNIYNDSCLKEEWKKEYAILIVRKKKIEVKGGTEITTFCPWSMPCLLESEMPPRRE